VTDAIAGQRTHEVEDEVAPPFVLSEPETSWRLRFSGEGTTDIQGGFMPKFNESGPSSSSRQSSQPCK
jgi:hypothetical protein